MKVLVFHIGADRYGLPLAAIRRVLPLMALKALPGAPPVVSGLMNLHGAGVPVIDLSALAGHAAAARRVDTRIVLVDYTGPDGVAHALGLVAERVQGVQQVDDGALAPAGVLAAPFLDRVAGDAQGIVQLVEPDRMLPDALRALLFQGEPR
ncbi:chemotaxis protein CheW [Pseudoduganella albidiflava]|uniref:Chemotaxis protein CheW n=1 Tax=Pseudoduganella albidiflava TaxID=321983 RepID=A0A411X1S6_9BURK|nr:chemotaxis protein CheW [Pseudoduganella albidiflava]QBI02940.1 chemotaxis protein CheW [Pseudoduganella albidiflava]GGY57503.1 chew domain protein [Pseudoduganella albidiflava]